MRTAGVLAACGPWHVRRSPALSHRQLCRSRGVVCQRRLYQSLPAGSPHNGVPGELAATPIQDESTLLGVYRYNCTASPVLRLFLPRNGQGISKGASLPGLSSALWPTHENTSQPRVVTSSSSLLSMRLASKLFAWSITSAVDSEKAAPAL